MNETEKLAEIQRAIEETKDFGDGKLVIFIKDGQISGWERVEDRRYKACFKEETHLSTVFIAKLP